MRIICTLLRSIELTWNDAHNSFWVAEKSDGVRVLLFVFTDINTMDQTVFIVSLVASWKSSWS